MAVARLAALLVLQVPGATLHNSTMLGDLKTRVLLPVAALACVLFGAVEAGVLSAPSPHGWLRVNESGVVEAQWGGVAVRLQALGCGVLERLERRDGSWLAHRQRCTEWVTPHETTFSHEWVFAEARDVGAVSVEVERAACTLRETGGVICAQGEFQFSYGAATWVDARGSRTAIVPVVNGSRLTWVVPAELVERSEFPAVLDPEVGPITEVDSTDYFDEDGTGAAILAEPHGWTLMTGGYRGSGALVTVDDSSGSLSATRVPAPTGAASALNLIARTDAGYMAAVPVLGILSLALLDPSGAVLSTQSYTAASLGVTPRIALRDSWGMVAQTILIGDGGTIGDAFIIDASGQSVDAGVQFPNTVFPLVARVGTYVLVGDTQIMRVYDSRLSLVNSISVSQPSAQGARLVGGPSLALLVMVGSAFPRAVSALRLSPFSAFPLDAPMPLAATSSGSIIVDSDATGFDVWFKPADPGNQHSRVRVPLSGSPTRIDYSFPTDGGSWVMWGAAHRGEVSLVTMGDPAETPSFMRMARFADDGGILDPDGVSLPKTSNEQRGIIAQSNGDTAMALWVDDRVNTGWSSVVARALSVDGQPLGAVHSLYEPTGLFSSSAVGESCLVSSTDQFIATWSSTLGTSAGWVVLDSVGQVSAGPSVLPGGSFTKVRCASNGDVVVALTSSLFNNVAYGLRRDGGVFPPGGVALGSTAWQPERSVVFDGNSFVAIVEEASGCRLYRFDPVTLQLTSNVAPVECIGRLVASAGDGFLAAKLTTTPRTVSVAVFNADAGTRMGWSTLRNETTGSNPVLASVAINGSYFVVLPRLNDAGVTELVSSFIPDDGGAPGPLNSLTTLQGGVGSIAAAAVDGGVRVFATVVDPNRFNVERALTLGVTLQPNGRTCGTAASCLSGYCVDGVCCESACGQSTLGDCQACSVAAGSSIDGACRPLSAGATCRAVAHTCDQAEQCDGVSMSCSADLFAPDNTACTGGVCSAGSCVFAATDAGAPDSGAADAGGADAGESDAGGADAADADAGGADAGTPDGGGADGGPIDSGALDASVPVKGETRDDDSGVVGDGGVRVRTRVLGVACGCGSVAFPDLMACAVVLMFVARRRGRGRPAGGSDERAPRT